MKQRLTLNWFHTSMLYISAVLFPSHHCIENPTLTGMPEPGFPVRVTTETKTVTPSRADTSDVVFEEFCACSSHRKGD